MSVPKDDMPIYDDRVNYIIRSLAAGINRDDLAKELKHKDYKALDMYMRRRNFTWDRDEQNYVPKETKIGKDKLIGEDIHTGKVSKIIKAFEVETDPKVVANELGFKNHKELADYMTHKGYEWNIEEGNYVRKVGVKQEENEQKVNNNNRDNQASGMQLKEDSELSQLIKTLYQKLHLDEEPIVDRVPRYLIKGIGKNKTVPISHLLHQLIESFSEENHITHREIFEVALVDFFRKYGYKYEVETLFKNEQ